MMFQFWFEAGGWEAVQVRWEWVEAGHKVIARLVVVVGTGEFVLVAGLPGAVCLIACLEAFAYIGRTLTGLYWERKVACIVSW